MHSFIPDPYEVLEIARDATQREVKQAYRRLAMKFHPDHNPEKPETEARFKQIQQAYEALTGRKTQGRIRQLLFTIEITRRHFSKTNIHFLDFIRLQKIILTDFIIIPKSQRMLKSWMNEFPPPQSKWRIQKIR